MFSQITTGALFSFILVFQFCNSAVADASLFGADTSKNNDLLIASGPEAYVHMDRIQMTAGVEVVSFPAEVRDVFYNGDKTIDSLTLSGAIVKYGHPDFDSIINQVSVGDELLDGLNLYGLSHLHRRLPYDPQDAIGDPSSYLYFDFSVYYEAYFLTSQDIVSTRADLRARTDIRDVNYSGLATVLTDEPPEPPPGYCADVNNFYMSEQWPLHPRNDSAMGAMGFADGWRHACDVFDPFRERGITVGMVDGGFGIGPDFHPDIYIHPLSNVIPGQGLFSTHGSAVASIIATKPFDITPDPSKGGRKSDYLFDGGYQMTGYIQGAAPRSSVLVTNINDGTGWVEDLSYLVNVTESANLRVINFSTRLLTNQDAAASDLLVYAHFMQGTELVAAAGNCDFQTNPDCNQVFLPASLPFVVTVANCRRDSTFNNETNLGNPIDLCAPGTDVLVAYKTYPTDGILPGSKPFDNTRLVEGNGTSFSSPHVAALVANVLEANPQLSGATATELIIGSTGNSQYSVSTGWGIPHAGYAIYRSLHYGLIGGSDLPGDVNLDLRVNDGDITSLARGLFFLEPFPDSGQADIDGDCEITVTDLNYLVEYLYSGGPPPLPPCVTGKSTSGDDGGSYPNPFNPTTTISFSLPRSGEWKMSIFNVLGQTVESFTGRNFAGNVEVVWDASDYASGVYFYRVTVKDVTFTNKMLLLK